MGWISDWRENAKRKVAEEAVDLIEDGWVVGLGTGTTVDYVTVTLGRKIREEGFDVLVVPTSYGTFLRATEERVPLTTLEEHPCLNLTIDSADEVDEKLNLIKGGGAALTREKIVGFASKKYVIVIDETKLVKKLGSSKPVPIEVLPFACPLVMKELKKFWSNVKIREGKGKAGPVITDNGNFIIDIHCGEIENPKQMDVKLREIPGVIETGLFLGMVDVVYVGSKNGKILKLF